MKTYEKSVELRFSTFVALVVSSLFLIIACAPLKKLVTPESADKTCATIDLAAEACKLIRVKTRDGSIVEVPIEDIETAAKARAAKAGPSDVR